MINHDYRFAKFSLPAEGVLKNAGATEEEAIRWYKKGLLSCDVTIRERLRWSEIMEVFFITYLYHSNHPEKMIDHFLSTLEKPYCFNPKEVYYDVFKQEWFDKPKETSPEKIIAEFMEARFLPETLFWEVREMKSGRN